MTTAHRHLVITDTRISGERGVPPPLCNHRCPVFSRAGYTLIEVMAVVTIMALVAGLAMPNLVHRATSDPVERTASHLRAAEHQVRCAAVGQGAHIELSSSGFTAQLVHQATARTDDEPIRTTIDDALSIEWRDARGDAMTSIDIDRRGRSADLHVEISDGQHDRHYLLAGASGEWTSLPLDTDLEPSAP